MERDIEAFLKYLSSTKGCSSNTVAAYRNDLSQLETYLESGRSSSSTGHSLDELLKGYLIDLRGKGYSMATAARKVASAKSFFRYLVETGKIKENPLRNLVSPQVAKRPPRYLTVADYRRLVAEPARLNTPEARRDVVMLELLYATGLRASELISLDVDDLDASNNCIHCGRGTSRRRVALNGYARDLVADFVTNGRLDLLCNEKEKALFLNRRGGRLTRQGFWQIIKNYASRAGLGDKVTPQTLRHTYAARRMQGGADIRSLQQDLGHAFLSSTRIYRTQPRQG
ncbi:MAG: tyrosine-type recombinase/integrase [Chloroflexota bacterium]